MRARGCRPEGVRVAVERPLHVIVCRQVMQCQVIRIAFANGLAELIQACNIFIGEQTSPVRCEAQHQLAAAPDGFLIRLHQLVDALRVVAGMPEPVAGVQRRIDLHWSPTQIAAAVDDVPILVRNCAGLIAHPACVAIFK